MLRIEQQLSDLSAGYDYLYEGLKTYLMLGDPAHFDADTVSAWVGLDWDQNLSRRLQADQLQQLRGHLDALLGAMPMALPMPLEGNLIASVRDYLQRVPLADRVYQRLRRTQLDSDLPEFRIIDGAGRDAPLVFVRRSGEALSTGIPGFYTARGYRDAFLGQSSLIGAQLTAESWVMGKEFSTADSVTDLLALSDQVRQLYLVDYARQWEDLLADIDITPFTGVQQATEVLRVSSGPASPIRMLLQAVDRQTSLSRVEAQPAAVGEQISGGLSAVKRKLASLIGESGTAAVTTAAGPSTNLVEQKFERLNGLVRGGDGGAAPIDNVIALLDEAFVLMNSIASASGRGETAVQVARDQAGGTLGRIKLEAQRQPPPLSRWLQALAQGGSGVALGDARAHLNDLWRGDVQQRCREATSGRYPFDPAAGAEIGLDDFGRLFSSGGLLDQFFNEQLRPFVDTTRKPWSWRGEGSRKLGISDAVLVQFQRAGEIRDAFFATGGPTPRVSFQLKPLAMDATISQFLLAIDGQTLTYSHGPARPSALQWPGPDGVGQAHMQISPAAPDGRSSVSIDGPWAFFRLLDRAALEPTGMPEQFRLRFDIGGRVTDYELRAGSARNPFNLNALRRFRCPGKL
jgi:type VI secretion system protein ImpL